jgi:Cu2+-containing amine oxidase
MHNSLWRIVPQVVSPSSRVYKVTNVENVDVNTGMLLPGAVIHEDEVKNEGAFDWDPKTFMSLLVKQDTSKNTLGSARGYELVPYGVTGIARHSQTGGGSQSDSWTYHDFWVTKDRLSEGGIRFTWTDPNNYLTPFTTPSELLSPGGKVIWYRSSFLHHVSDHDRDSNGNDAIISAHWAGFDFHPHNFFDFNPMTGGLPKCK